MDSREAQVRSNRNEESEVETEEENDVKKSDVEAADLSPTENQKKRSKWRRLKDKSNRKDKNKSKSKGKENAIEMMELDDREKAKESQKLSKLKLNNKERGLFKRPSLKDYRKKWKGGPRRESPVSPKLKQETKFQNGASPSHQNKKFEEERRSKKWTQNPTQINDSPTSFEQTKVFEMIWARRAFFMSTEKIFPGFTRNYELRNNRSRDPTGVKLRTSIPLKMCLFAHAFFVPIWFIAFLSLQEFATNSLKPLHNYVHSCLTYVCMVTDALRLYAGFMANTRDDMQLLMAFYFGYTVILQTPMMCFIFATHSFSVHVLVLMSTMDIILACILLFEIWFSFWQLKQLVSSEINLLHMARQMNELTDHGRTRHPRVINSTEKGPYLNWSDGSDKENNGDTKVTSTAKQSGTMGE